MKKVSVKLKLVSIKSHVWNWGNVSVWIYKELSFICDDVIRKNVILPKRTKQIEVVFSDEPINKNSIKFYFRGYATRVNNKDNMTYPSFNNFIRENFGEKRHLYATCYYETK